MICRANYQEKNNLFAFPCNVHARVKLYFHFILDFQLLFIKYFLLSEHFIEIHCTFIYRMEVKSKNTHNPTRNNLQKNNQILGGNLERAERTPILTRSLSLASSRKSLT